MKKIIGLIDTATSYEPNMGRISVEMSEKSFEVVPTRVAGCAQLTSPNVGDEISKGRWSSKVHLIPVEAHDQLFSCYKGEL